MLYTRPPSIGVLDGDPFESKCESIIVPVFQDDEGKPILDYVRLYDRNKLLEDSVKLNIFRGDVGSIFEAIVDGKFVVYVGIGRRSVKEYILLENSRRGFAAGVKRVAGKFKCIALALSSLSLEAASEALIASLLASYRLDAFKSSREPGLEVILVDRSDIDLKTVRALAEGVYLARDIANAPPHDVTPAKLAEKISELFRELPNTEVEIYDYDRLVREGFGGIVNVGMGSNEKPVMIVVKYRGSNSKPIALVGKTVIFDSGGINIKTGESMFYMRSDKAGGAAVLGVIWAAAKAQLRVNIAGLVPAVINVPSGSSYLPGDVIRMWDGTMVEVTNTDAEGRLIIGDAIAYAAKALEAGEIIDLATLTGAIVVALGPLIAGLFTRDNRLKEKLLEASNKTGEKLWPMPMEDDYKPWLTRSAIIGDMANSGTRVGGAIYGALFLERYAHGKPFAHIDIAGPGMGYEAKYIAPPYWPDKDQAPGYGVRLIFQYLLTTQ
ncbi:MAG: leucyl aminopeptidase family protein [Acidilobaceae archaeon]